MKKSAPSLADKLALTLEQRRRVRERKVPPLLEWLQGVSPQHTWTWEHLEYIRQHLERVESGEIKKLILSVPPRHGKSEMTTIHFPGWLLEKHPQWRVIVGAYNATLAEKFSRRTRALVRRRNRVIMDEERQAVSDWLTEAGGGVRAVGVGGGINGQGANGIIIDDPVKSREEADSIAFRNRVYDWYREDVYTRLEPDGFIIIIMTRWHDDDLVGRILKSEDAPNWTVINLPALAGKDDALGRAPGEALCPDRFDEVKLADLRKVIGERGFLSLYQGKPVPDEGAMFKQTWFSRIIMARQVPEGLRWVRFWDLATSIKQKADFTASAAAAIDKDGNIYIRDFVRCKSEWPETRKTIIQTTLLERNVETFIEAVGFQLAAVQDLLAMPDLVGRPIRAVDVHTDKVVRANAWSYRAETGKVVLVEGEHMQEFLAEISVFPFGAHDDMVDAVSGAIAALMSGRSSTIIGHMEKQFREMKQREMIGQFPMLRRSRHGLPTHKPECLEAMVTAFIEREKNRGGPEPVCSC